MDINYWRWQNTNRKKENEEEPTWIKIPQGLLINTNGPKIPAIVNTIYSDFQNNYLNIEYLKQRAILTPTNGIVDDINSYILTLIPGEAKEYLSADSISKSFDTINDVDILYPIEYLNTLNANNFPQHKLILKVGVPIILLRNLNQSIGLCNGTRLIVTNLGDNVIEAIIITGSNIGDKVYIP
jgi:ATP-dependent DNA helicase PIF1